MDNPNRRIQIVIFGLVGVLLVYEYSQALFNQSAQSTEEFSPDQTSQQESQSQHAYTEVDNNKPVKFQIFKNEGGRETPVRTRVDGPLPNHKNNDHSNGGGRQGSHVHELRVLYCGS